MGGTSPVSGPRPLFDTGTREDPRRRDPVLPRPADEPGGATGSEARGEKEQATSSGPRAPRDWTSGRHASLTEVHRTPSSCPAPSTPVPGRVTSRVGRPAAPQETKTEAPRLGPGRPEDNARETADPDRDPRPDVGPDSEVLVSSGRWGLKGPRDLRSPVRADGQVVLLRAQERVRGTCHPPPRETTGRYLRVRSRRISSGRLTGGRMDRRRVGGVEGGPHPTPDGAGRRAPGVRP
ncbi:Hypothetical predicted protein [Marmota monax]|uniref:Uncharacterized protein n=1 Tax=Marmota monax TaxID=9995 RepID=A0A5E4BYW5_MARMO|nr:Hypothetical predicted protein [Marmota monax]